MKTSNMDNTPLYNSRIIDTYIKFIKRNYSYINISELLSYAGMESYQVTDEGHWFTQKQIDLFYERLEKLTKNKNIAREAGRYAALPETIGVMRQHVLGLVGPSNAYKLMGTYAPKFTKSSIYESKETEPNKIEIIVTPKEGVSEKPFQCENRIGYFEAIALMFNYRLPEIAHTECIFKGGSACRYIVSWRESYSAFWKKTRNYATLILSALCLGSYFTYPWIALTTILPSSAFAVLLLTLYAEITEKRELNMAINNLRGSTDKLLKQIDVNYNNALMINEVGLSLSKQMDIDSILSNVIQVLEKRLDYDRGMILLANQEKSMLSFRAGFGYANEHFNLLKNTRFQLKPESKGVFVVSFREQKPFMINDINEIEAALSPRSLEFAKIMGAKAFICCPIIYEEKSLGILVVDNIKTKSPLLQSDISLLMGIAPGIGISIHNALLIEAKEHQFRSLLQVLAATIDARDPLTAGHSEKVTEYAVGICRNLGLLKDYSEMVRVASLLHDYGKIGIRDAILLKAGKLNVTERKEIETHVEKTREILEQVNFDGIYREVPVIAGAHHEKIDGSGYPNGLKGEDIALGAKIIAVADFFEAITSKRHYRDPMPLDSAFRLLKEESGKHLDEKIVAAFMGYYRKEVMGNLIP
ncbi:MAG: hypothetical protein HW406_447 [Candidatus Brocadiaceae bacterium]|nr:hypothetical protein [Candidatus Brocadiaceae bacterium]